MDVRKWVRQQVDKAIREAGVYYADAPTCADDIVEAFAPTIGKLVEALRDLHDAVVIGAYGGSGKSLSDSVDAAENALAELEKSYEGT